MFHYFFSCFVPLHYRISIPSQIFSVGFPSFAVFPPNSLVLLSHYPVAWCTYIPSFFAFFPLFFFFESVYISYISFCSYLYFLFILFLFFSRFSSPSSVFLSCPLPYPHCWFLTPPPILCPFFPSPLPILFQRFLLISSLHFLFFKRSLSRVSIFLFLSLLSTHLFSVLAFFYLFNLSFFCLLSRIPPYFFIASLVPSPNFVLPLSLLIFLLSFFQFSSCPPSLYDYSFHFLYFLCHVLPRFTIPFLYLSVSPSVYYFLPSCLFPSPSIHLCFFLLSFLPPTFLLCTSSSLPSCLSPSSCFSLLQLIVVSPLLAQIPHTHIFPLRYSPPLHSTLPLYPLSFL